MTDKYYAIVCRPATTDGNGVVVTTVSLSGEFDLSVCADLRAAVLDAIAAGSSDRVTIDLADVSFIDSETIRVLLECYTTALDQGTELRLANAHGLVLHILDVAGITEVLQPDEA